jgi:putative Holliday junction resolvase
MSLCLKKRILALDVGEKRIGVALSDFSRSLAQPLCVIARQNRDQVVKDVGELARTHEVGLIVLGLPEKSEDDPGPAALAIRRLGERLSRALNLPVAYVDEFETTKEAEQALLTADIGRRKRRRVVDMLAASLILQRYLKEQAGRGAT